MEVRPIRPGEERAAGALVYGLTRGTTPGEEEVTAFLDQARVLGTDLSRQVVAVTPDGRIVGCAMYFPMPDRTATVTPPLCAPEFDAPAVRVDLMRTLRTKALDDQLLILQVFCEETDPLAADVLTESGFDELAVMLFMERRTVDADRNIVVDKQIRWTPYSDARHDEFVRVISDTYKDTLDCARLGEMRDVDLTLEGYRSRGRFDPSLWLLANLAGETVACLLLIHHPEENDYEVAYVAVVPSHRGKGLGCKVMKKGLFEVALRSPRSTLRLAVDEANVPATRIYRDVGFSVTERKRVFFSLLATA